MTPLYKVLEEAFPEIFPKTPDVPPPSGTSKQTTSLEVIKAASPSVAVEDPNAVVSVEGNEEILLNENGSHRRHKFDYRVKARDVPGVQKRLVRLRKIRGYGFHMPAPTCVQPHGTTEELFGRIRKFIAEYTGLPAADSALLTFWIFSTWFQDTILVAPPLFITGSAHEGDVVLRTLRAFCFRPFLTPGLATLGLKNVQWNLGPTLLIYEPNLSKATAALVASSTGPGYCMPVDKVFLDYYCAKALYVGEAVPAGPLPPRCLHINVASSRKAASADILSMPMESTQRYQNELLDYRVTNLVHVSGHSRAIPGSRLSSEKLAIATALGRCIVDAPALQAELIALLTERARQETDERRESLEASVLEAALHLCHEGKTQIYVKEIAAEVDRMRGDRGQELKLSAEKVGHLLKKLGLHSRRLDKAGNGLTLDLATRAQLHELAAPYFDGGSMLAEENLHCDLCEKPQPLAQVM
jgi:hypothetical protein